MNNKKNIVVHIFMEEEVQNFPHKKGHQKFWRMKRTFLGKSQTEKCNLTSENFLECLNPSPSRFHAYTTVKCCWPNNSLYRPTTFEFELKSTQFVVYPC